MSLEVFSRANYEFSSGYVPCIGVKYMRTKGFQPVVWAPFNVWTLSSTFTLGDFDLRAFVLWNSIEVMTLQMEVQWIRKKVTLFQSFKRKSSCQRNTSESVMSLDRSASLFISFIFHMDML